MLKYVKICFSKLLSFNYLSLLLRQFFAKIKKYLNENLQTYNRIQARLATTPGFKIRNCKEKLNKKMKK